MCGILKVAKIHECLQVVEFVNFSKFKICKKIRVFNLCFYLYNPNTISCWCWCCDAAIIKMLTSSDAKFRCMWYMVVWSILLMFMSQFFNVTNVIAFYIFASATMLLLPLVTSIYSTTSGNHGASLLRYVNNNNNNSNSNNRSSRSTEPSTLCGMVKWVSAFELSNNDGDGGCSFIAAYTGGPMA